jgi:hypothetical protein
MFLRTQQLGDRRADDRRWIYTAYYTYQNLGGALVQSHFEWIFPITVTKSRKPGKFLHFFGPLNEEGNTCSRYRLEVGPLLITFGTVPCTYCTYIHWPPAMRFPRRDKCIQKGSFVNQMVNVYSIYDSLNLFTRLETPPKYTRNQQSESKILRGFSKPSPTHFGFFFK